MSRGGPDGHIAGGDVHFLGLDRWVPFGGLPPGQAVVAIALLVAGAGTAVAAITLPGLSLREPVPILVLLALVVVTRLQTLPLLERSSFSVSVVPVLAGGMLLGASGAAALALVSGIAHGLVRRLPWHKIAFNCGNYTIAAVLAATVFHAIAPPLALDALPLLLGVGVLAGLTHYLHTFVVAVAIATERRVPPVAVWHEHFAWLWAQYGVLGLLALLLALAQREFGAAGAAVFVVPPLLMLQMAKQYIDRTSENVLTLQALNRELTNEIRQRAAAEEESARLAREAGRAAALEEQSRIRSRFISILSHEMRTSLSIVIGYNALVLADTEPSDPRHHLLEIAHECAEQISRLFDDLLDTSRIEVGQIAVHPTAVDLTRAVPPVLDALRAGAPGHDLACSFEPNARWVWADQDKLRQMLTNLVANAIKYSPAGGDVRVRTAPGASPDTVEVIVSDQGIGIDPEEQAHIFDPYRRGTSSATRRMRGAGLGLYIVRSLAELQGGSVRVESEVGRGSTFHVVLPRPSEGDES